MRLPFALFALKSHYCKAVFIIALVVGFFILPHNAFVGYYKILAGIFMLTSAFSAVCIVRNIKERIKLAHTYGASLVQIFLLVLGFSAFQFCGLGALTCGLGASLAAVYWLFPAFVVQWLASYGVFFIVLSIVMQLLMMYFLGCWRVNQDQSVNSKRT